MNFLFCLSLIVLWCSSPRKLWFEEESHFVNNRQKDISSTGSQFPHDLVLCGRSNISQKQQVLNTETISKQVLQLFLICSGIESNPGPAPESKKRRFRGPPKCVSCGQFLGQLECPCIQLRLRSTRNSTDDSAGTSGNFVNQFTLYTTVANSTIVPYNVSQFQRISSSFGLPFIALPFDVDILRNAPLATLLPSKVHGVPGDGNCLFSSLSVAIGSNVESHVKIRSLICEFLPSLNINPQLLEVYSYVDGRVVVHSSKDVHDYLSKSRMDNSGVFGTCVEIFAFAQLFNCDVFVYHSISQSWVVYSFEGNRDLVNVIPVFLFHTPAANHFETVAELSSASNLMHNSSHGSTDHSTDRTPKCSAMKLSEEMLVSEYSSLSELHHFDNTAVNAKGIVDNNNNLRNQKPEPFSEPDAKKVCHDWQTDDGFSIVKQSNYPLPKYEETSYSNDCSNISCGKCGRVSTNFYTLKWHQITEVTFKLRRYGKKIQRNSIVCHCCIKYLRFGRSWCHAWPSVLYSCLTNLAISDNDVTFIYSLIPTEIRCSWLDTESFHPALKKKVPPVFSDVTNRKLRFIQKIESGVLKDLEDALDMEPYPNCRCPFGCFAFLEQTGAIQFNNLLNKIVPSLVMFNSSYERHLRGSRYDWLKPFTVLDSFVISGCVFLHDTKGLVIGTCLKHDNGSVLQYVHPPTHPSLGRLGVPCADRLALAVPNLHLLKNVKSNYSTHTYQLLQAQGNYNGISSMTLSSKRFWDMTSDLLVKAESQCTFFRQDVQYLLEFLVGSGEITKDMKQDFCFQPDVGGSTDSLISSTSVSLWHTKKLLNSLAVNNTNALCAKFKTLAFAHGPSSFGAAPLKLKHKKDFFLFLLQSFFVISPCLCDMLSTACLQQTKFLPVLHFLNPVIFPKGFGLHVRSVTDDKNAVMQLLFHYEGNSGMKLATFLANKCNHVLHRDIEHRSSLQHVVDTLPFSSNDIFIVTYSGSNTLRTKYNLPLFLETSHGHFELRHVAKENTAGAFKILVRHGGKFDKFWLYDNYSPIAKRIPLTAETAMQHHINGYWNVAIFYRSNEVQIETLKSQFMENMAGQGKYICQEHKIPLTRDFCKSGFKCSCGKAFFIRCPILSCSSSVCRQHTVHISEGQNWISSMGKNNENPDIASENDPFQSHSSMISSSTDNNEEAVSQLSVLSSKSNSTDSFNFLTDPAFLQEPSENSLVSLPENTAVGQKLCFTPDNVIPETEFRLPLHILLNGHCGLLKRSRGSPVYVAARHKRMLENITSTASPKSVPLLQPEAMMFPTIFWKQNYDGSYPGALPSSLFNSASNNANVGFASLEDHLQTRLKDSSLLTSSDPRYVQYVFDTIFNLHLRENDTRVVLNRGWGEAAKTYRQSQRVKEGALFFDQCDSRKNVNELSAALKEQAATYFFTYTCSQSTHPGIRKIFAALESKYPAETTNKEVRNAAIQAEMIPMLRAWERASRLIMKFIETSHEQPLGKVRKIWYRYEFQDQTSAFPHIHALIWTGENVFSNIVRSRICCSPSQFIGNLLMERSDQHFTSSDLSLLQELFEKIQAHSCRKAKFRCQKVTEKYPEGTCRVPKYPAAVDFTYKSIDKKFSVETWDLLRNLDLAFQDSLSGNMELAEVLKGGKHHYPTDANSHYSPTNAAIFSLVRSSTNLQICDAYMCGRYLSKYAAGVEERSEVFIHSSNERNHLGVTTNGQCNEKISGVHFRKSETEKRRKGKLFLLVSLVLPNQDGGAWNSLMLYPILNLFTLLQHLKRRELVLSSNVKVASI